MLASTAKANRMAKFTTSRLRTGKTPGCPRQIGQVLWFGIAPNEVEQPQKSFVFVLSWQ
jgi:hypothetical protein